MACFLRLSVAVSKTRTSCSVPETEAKRTVTPISCSVALRQYSEVNSHGREVQADERRSKRRKRFAGSLSSGTYKASSFSGEWV